MRLAPNVFVSMMSAPARTYSWCTSATRSGCVRFSASKLLLMKTPLAYSIVPIAPSQTSTRVVEQRRGTEACFNHQPITNDPMPLDPARSGRRRRSSRYDLRHDVEADRADALADRVGEP